MRWIGVDVGGDRKGFDLAIIDDAGLLSLRGRLNCADVAGIVEDVNPLVVAIDSPCCCAARGQTTRECERTLARRICGIRWTPEAAAVNASDYYGWVIRGLELYGALQSVAVDVIEVFRQRPGPDGSASGGLGRARSGPAMGCPGSAERCADPDQPGPAGCGRGRAHGSPTQCRLTESIGEIVVPLAEAGPSTGQIAPARAAGGSSASPRVSGS
jgi:predicted nuclease with RNAse H fold